MTRPRLPDLPATTRLQVTLPSGVHAHAIVAIEAIGVAIGDTACIAHHAWMTAAQLRQVSAYAAELADALDGPP